MYIIKIQRKKVQRKSTGKSYCGASGSKTYYPVGFLHRSQMQHNRAFSFTGHYNVLTVLED